MPEANIYHNKSVFNVEWQWENVCVGHKIGYVCMCFIQPFPFVR